MFFHFSKALWEKCRDYGLTKKKFRKESTLLTFCFKLFPYIHNNYRGEYIEKINNYVKNKDKRFQKFLNYFLKNWFNNKSYNFNRISNENFREELITFVGPSIGLLIIKLVIITQKLHI